MTPILLVHVITAIFTLSFSLFAWLHPFRSIRLYTRLLALVSFSTGIAVTAQSGNLDLVACTKLGIYLLILILTDLRLSNIYHNNDIVSRCDQKSRTYRRSNP